VLFRSATAAGQAVGVATAPLTFAADAAATATKAVLRAQVSPKTRAYLDEMDRSPVNAFERARRAAGQSMFDAALGGLGAGVVRQGLGAIDPEAGADYQRDVEQMREEAPVASGYGTIAGLGAGLAMSGGAGIARAAPLSAVTRAGAAVEGAAARGLSGLAQGGVMGRAASAAGQLAARGAVEGAALGATEYVGDAMLQDHDLAADKLYAAMGHGALVGGLTGGVLGGGGSLAASGVRGATSLLGRAARRLGGAGGEAGLATRADVKRFAEKAFGGTSDDVIDSVVDHYAKASAAVAGKDAPTIRTMLARGPEGANLRRVAVFEHEAITDAATRSVRSQGDELLAATKNVTEEAMGGLKAGHVAKSVATGNEEATRAWASQYADDVIGNIDNLLAGRTAPQFEKSMRTASVVAYDIKAAVAKGASNAELFVEIDRAKRALQRASATGHRSVPQIADYVDQEAARNALKVFEDVAERGRQGLQDTALWGKAAEQQTAINEAWTRQIDASNRFRSSLTTKVGADPSNRYRQLIGIDPEKAASYVKNLTNVDRDLTHKAVKDYLQATEDLTQAIKGAYELSPSKIAEVERAGKAATSFRSSLQEAEKALVAANQYRELTKGDKASIMGVLGTVIGGAPGGAIGAVADALVSPGKTVARVAAIERLVAQVDAATSSAARNLVTPKLGAGSGAKAGAKTIAEDARTRAGRTLKWLSEARANVPAFAERVAQTSDAIGEVAPKVAASYTARIAHATAFLASKAPGSMPSNPLDPKPSYQMTELEAGRFARYAEAVENPMSVLRQAKRGTVSREAIEALRETSPRLYQELRQRTLDVLASTMAEGRLIPYERRLALSMMFDIPGDRSLEPRAFIALQANTAGAQQAQQKPQGPGPASVKPPQRPLKLDTNISSPWDKVERGRTARR
jgi:hypothetical protein